MKIHLDTELIAEGVWVAKASCGCCGHIGRAIDSQAQLAAAKAIAEVRKKQIRSGSGDCAVKTD